MSEEVNIVKEEFKQSNDKSIGHLDTALKKIRVGKATPDMLQSVTVDYYGTQTPLSQVANVGTLDGRTLTVQPWEKGMLKECEKGIVNASLGLAPQDNGEMLIINVPPLTEERRKELVKRAKAEGEQAKVSVRNHRKDAMDYIKELKNDGLSEDEAKVAEDEVQQITDQYVAIVEDRIERKEKDILTI
ncbi:MAG: ribosome recycling factor [Bacteroidota bacterium]